MTVYQITTIKRFVGLEDERPGDMSEVPTGSRLLEADTATEFIYVGDYFATGTLTMAANADADDTILLDETTYTFVVEEPSEDEIEIGGTIAATLINIAAAINGTDGINTAHESVTAEVSGADTVLVTALDVGSDGEVASVYTHDGEGTNAFGAATLEGGHDQWQELP